MDKKHKDKPSDENKAKCEHCFKEFSSLKKLKEHCKHFHGLSLKCEICGVTCITKFEYDEHMISHGEKPKDVQKSEIAVGSLLPKPENMERYRMTKTRAKCPRIQQDALS